MKPGNVEAVRQLLYLIAHHQGFGALLAEGVMRASQKIDARAKRCAIYTMKGNTPRGHDHTTRWFEMFDTCVSIRGTIETGPTPLYLGSAELLVPKTRRISHQVSLRPRGLCSLRIASVCADLTAGIM